MADMKDSCNLPSLNSSDPIIYLAKQVLKVSPKYLALSHIILNAIIIFAGGAFLSYYIFRDAPIIRVFDSEHLLYALFASFVLLPVIWYLYLVQPRVVSSALTELEKEKIIKIDGFKSLSDFVASKVYSIDNLRLSLLALLVAVLFITVQICYVFPNESSKMAKYFFWYKNKLYFYFFFVTSTTVGYYLAAMLVFRAIGILFMLNSLFRHAIVETIPLHPDEAGGLGPVGRLGIKFSSVAVGLGFMATGVTIARLILGVGWAYADVLLLYTLYIILVPITLIMPIWSAHAAMVNKRDSELSKISVLFRKEYNAPNVSQENLKSLQERHKQIKEVYPVWPISGSLLRQFSIKASIPLVTGYGSVLIDIAIKKGST